MEQARAMESAASAANAKVDAKTRKQIIAGAGDIYRQAMAASGIAKKTYDRTQSLYAQGVVSEQKRDEAKAAYDAAKAGEAAAKSQYELAKAGAQKEDKEAARAMVNVAKGSVNEVGAVLEDRMPLLHVRRSDNRHISQRKRACGRGRADRDAAEEGLLGGVQRARERRSKT